MLKSESLLLTLEKEKRKDIIMRFSNFVYENKKIKAFDTLSESLQDILDNQLFGDEVDYDNVGKYLDENIKERIFIEAVERKMIKEESIPKKLKGNKLF